MDTLPFISLLEKAIEVRKPLFDAEHQSAFRLVQLTGYNVKQQFRFLKKVE